jgi:cytoskeletal protein RodZ
VASWAESVAAEQPGALTVEQEAASEQREAELSRTERVLESFAPAVAQPPNELTISDVRRARRATGLTLAQISERSRIPVALLRELEWGYLRNWPSGHYGRTQLVRYARAAGLDEEVVVGTVLPIFDELPRAAGLVSVPALNDEPDALNQADFSNVTWLASARPAAGRLQPSRRSRILAALAIPALVALAVAPAVWYRASLRAPNVGIPAPITIRADVPSATIAPSTTGRSDAQQASTSQPDRRVPAAERTAIEPETRQVVEDTRRTRGLTMTEVAYSPSFSSAGSAMFYHTGSQGPSALMRADTDGGGAVLRITRIVDDSASNFHVRPSPNGARIAFDSDRDGQRAVFVADADGRNVRRVSGDGFAAVPSWSPDSETLAFVRAEPEHPQVWNLWTTDLTTGTFRRLTNHRVGQPWGGSWFPDGRRIAYSVEDRLVILDLQTGTEKEFASPKRGRLVRTPAVSPDGSRIVFQVRRDGAWLLEMKDGSMRKILSDPTAEEYTWSPDGRRVAYHSGRTGAWGVWVMALH